MCTVHPSSRKKLLSTWPSSGGGNFFCSSLPTQFRTISAKAAAGHRKSTFHLISVLTLLPEEKKNGSKGWSPACPLSKSSSCTIKRPAPRQICSIRVQTNEKLKREKFRRFCSVLAECPPSFFAANVPMFLLFSFFLPEGIFLWFEDCVNVYVCELCYFGENFTQTDKTGERQVWKTEGRCHIFQQFSRTKEGCPAIRGSAKCSFRPFG